MKVKNPKSRKYKDKSLGIKSENISHKLTPNAMTIEPHKTPSIPAIEGPKNAAIT